MQDPSDFQRSHHVRQCKHYVSSRIRKARRRSSLPALMLYCGRRAMDFACPRHLYRSDLGPPDFVGVPSRPGRMGRVFHAALRFQDRGAGDTPARYTVGRWLRRETANIGVRFHFFCGHLRYEAMTLGLAQTECPSLYWIRTISTLVNCTVAPTENVMASATRVIATYGPGRAWEARTR